MAKGGKREKKKEEEKPRRRVPRSSAVVLNCPEGQYSEIMKEVRQKIQLNEVGIAEKLRQDLLRLGPSS
ncbi:hypothetical protein PUN28_020633 [Cardiocondyla obscurior]|uniref:Uncharacterized protein n=1 Tax=Cardiocondyla obscurior TaxID=286306 RepID=A0AAW2EA64_9HYME